MDKGQVTVDLPDPLNETEPVGVPTADATGAPATDELMAQLAGDEIDRLLAEAEVDRAPVGKSTTGQASPDPAGGVVGVTKTDEATDETNDVLDDAARDMRSDARDGGVGTTGEVEKFPPTEKAVNAVQKASAAVTDEAVASLDAELEDLFKQIQADPQATPSIEPAPVAETVVEPAPSVHESDAVSEAVPMSMSAPNDAIATDALVAAASAGATSKPHLDEKVELKLDALPSAPLRRSLLGRVLIKPLEWVNFPLAGADASIRITMGKIAILTLFNAIAVIVYVLVFRGK